MAVAGGIMVPHPPLIVPEIGQGEERRVQETTDAYREAARTLAAWRPDTVVILSPHTVMYADYFHISPGDGAMYPENSREAEPPDRGCGQRRPLPHTEGGGALWLCAGGARIPYEGPGCHRRGADLCPPGAGSSVSSACIHRKLLDFTTLCKEMCYTGKQHPAAAGDRQ